MDAPEDRPEHISSVEAPRCPSRALAVLAATATAACLGIGLAKGHEVYQDLQNTHYEIDIDKLVGGTQH